MKIPLIILLLAFSNCAQTDKKTIDLKHTQESNLELTKSKDSSENFEIVKSDSKFPKWLIKEYPNEIKIGIQTIIQKIENFESINDSLKYYTYSQSDGVCVTEYLVTFINRNKKDSLQITEMCDHEQSIPSYSWKESAILNQKTIVTMEYKESVLDSLIDNDGNIKWNLDFSEAETKIDSTFTDYEINELGLINEIQK